MSQFILDEQLAVNEGLNPLGMRLDVELIELRPFAEMLRKNGRARASEEPVWKGTDSSLVDGIGGLSGSGFVQKAAKHAENEGGVGV